MLTDLALLVRKRGTIVWGSSGVVSIITWPSGKNLIYLQMQTILTWEENICFSKKDALDLRPWKEENSSVKLHKVWGFIGAARIICNGSRYNKWRLGCLAVIQIVQEFPRSPGEFGSLCLQKGWCQCSSDCSSTEKGLFSRLVCADLLKGMGSLQTPSTDSPQKCSRTLGEHWCSFKCCPTP